MPALTNPKHERFCQELAKGKTQDEAYQIAGYKQSRSNASMLRAKKNIVNRVDELLGAVAEKAVVDAAWVLEQLVANAKRAMSVAEGNVANRALELIGKHVAVQAFRDQIAHTGKDGGPIQHEEVSVIDRLSNRITELAARQPETKH